MKAQSTYTQLSMILNDIQQQCALSISFAIFHRTKIDAFQKDNKVRISIMEENLRKLADQYCKKDDNGNLIIQQVDGSPRYDFNSEDDQIAYKAVLTEFMDTPIELIYL